jgi:hypothetical protein
MPRLLLIALLSMCVGVPVAEAKSAARARQCKASCAGTIERCVQDGGRRKKCRRDVLRSCKRQGVAVCGPPPTFFVATTGGDATGCGTAEAPCRTIQFVVDNMIPLDGAGAIKVAAGTYDQVADCPTGTIPNGAVVCVLNRQVTLLGGFAPGAWDTPSGDPEATILDGGRIGRGIRIQGGSDGGNTSLVVDGFTFENGMATAATSGQIDGTFAYGGALFSEHAAVTVRNAVFRDNRSIGPDTDNPQGGRGAGGAVALAATPTSKSRSDGHLENVRFESNEALGGRGLSMGGYALGGALFTFNVRLTGSDLVFADNTATAGTTDGVGYDGSELADALGGAISIEEGSEATLERVTFTTNVARGGFAPNGWGGGAFGGGVFGERAQVTLRDALVDGNLAQGGAGENDGGGGLAEGGGIHTILSSCTIERSVVTRNTALGGAGRVQGGSAVGGGIAMVSNSSPGHGTDESFAFRNVVVADNSLNGGTGSFSGGGAGGIWVQGSVGTIDHATIADNHILDGRLAGAGLTLVDQPGWQTHVTVTNTIVANHTDPSANPQSWSNAAVWVGLGAQADLTRTLFANNAHDTNAGVSIGFNLPAGTVNLTGTLNAPDAGFVSAGGPSDDYHLLSTSPAIDQADASGIADDLDGESRPQGGAADIGADEYTP